MSATEERIAALEKKNEELLKLVEALKTELTATEKRLDQLETQGGKQQQQQQGKKGGKKNKGGDNKKGGDKKKEEKKDGGDKKKEEREKAVKAAIKEGGKKGQDLCGMHDMGGMAYFTVAMEKCAGDWGLLEDAMKGANKEVDPNADDRKGGAHDLAKCFMTMDEAKYVYFLYHAPKKLQEEKGLSLKQWVDFMMNDVGVQGEVLEITDETCKAVATQNKDKELFPLKQRDAAINASFKCLRERNLIPEDDDDSEDDMSEMYENAGIEW